MRPANNNNNQENFFERAFYNLFQWRTPFANAAEGAFQGCILANFLTCFITVFKEDITIEDSAFILKCIGLATLAGGVTGFVTENVLPIFRRPHL